MKPTRRNEIRFPIPFQAFFFSFYQNVPFFFPFFYIKSSKHLFPLKKQMIFSGRCKTAVQSASKIWSLLNMKPLVVILKVPQSDTADNPNVAHIISIVIIPGHQVYQVIS